MAEVTLADQWLNQLDQNTGTEAASVSTAPASSFADQWLQQVPDVAKSKQPDAVASNLASEELQQGPPTGFGTVRASLPGRFSQGMADPGMGALQLLTTIPGIDKSGILKQAQARDLKFQGIDVPEGLLVRSPDEIVRQNEMQYQGARQATGQEGFDTARLAGNLASPINLGIGSKIPQGVSWLARLGYGMLGGGISGGLQPVTSGDFWTDKALQTGAGTIGGGPGGLLGKSISASASKAANIERSVAENAARQAASDTASARSAAGTAAQNAYRQLEHLRELGVLRGLTPEEAQVAAQLENELAQKAREKLLPAAAEKEATAGAYKKAMETEAERAAQLATDKLGMGEIKSQIMARAKRYGPAALIGGGLGYYFTPGDKTENALFGVGAGIGSGVTAGLYLRPMMRSMVTLSKNPAVQYGVTSRVGKLPFNDPRVPATFGLLSSRLGPGGLLAE